MKILLADDDRVNRCLLETYLVQWNYEVVHADDGEQAWNILRQEGAPKLAILDWMMPGMDGLQICRELRKSGDNPRAYVLLLTADHQKQDIAAGLETGADDYLTKPFDANELRARLRSARRILALQEQLTAARHGMGFHATYDALTGLRTQASILETLRLELARARREGNPLSLLMAGLDHFQQIADTCGDIAADAVLRETADRLHYSVRPYDSIGRYGSDEFLIILPGCDVTTAARRAEDFRMAIANKSMDTPEGLIPVTLSLGVTAGGGPQPSETVSLLLDRLIGSRETGDERETAGGPQPSEAASLLRAADIALCQAKNAGRNQVEVSAVFRG